MFLLRLIHLCDIWGFYIKPITQKYYLCRLKNSILVKTNQEIKDYIKTLRASDEGNEYAIVHYCETKLNLKVKFQPPKDSMPVATFSQFKEWAERDFPVENSAIVIEDPDCNYVNAIAYVSRILHDSIILGASITEDGNLITNKLSIPFNTKIRKATQKEVNRLTTELFNADMEWSFEYSRIIERFIPKQCNYVKFVSNSGKRGIGVFREITKDGKVILFCVKLENEPIQHSLNEYIGNSCDIRFSSVSQVEKNLFREELERVGKIWNGYSKRIEPINFRLKKGKSYYYINDKFNVAANQETNSAQDRLKFNCGNYFTSLEEINEMIDYMTEFRKAQLARPEKTKGEQKER